MPKIYLETSALSWPALEAVNWGSLTPGVGEYVLEELAALPDSPFKDNLLAQAQSYPQLPTSPQARELTSQLSQELALAPQLLRHLAQARGLNMAALLTLDPQLLALPTLLALKKAPWPLVARPESLSWPAGDSFRRWAAFTRQELAQTTQNLSRQQKLELIQQWRERPIETLNSQGNFQDDLAPLSPDPHTSLPLWLAHWRESL
ncbi:MAG: hypothetical protein LBT86_05360 [Deltaproteobacteria bacterium]|jgi:hypothetical protein|nr:hypothetical protein [Deltaproteobacteria bacterium]